MALKIRLRQQGRKNALVYRLVVTDSRSPRDGKYIEMLGSYNPQAKNEDQILTVNGERILHWMDHGAQISEKAESLVKKMAPAVLRQIQEKQQKKREKERLRRKARKEKKAA